MLQQLVGVRGSGGGCSGQPLQLCGRLMVARSHVTHEHVDNLSREQIVEQLQEFMDRAKNRMIDVTPAENPTEPEQNPITDYSQEAAE